MCVNYYDWVKIRYVNKLCDTPSESLWKKSVTLINGNIVDDDERPPMALGDIAMFQISLFGMMREVVCELPFAGAFSIAWQSESGKSLHRVARLDMEKLDTGAWIDDESRARIRDIEITKPLIDVFFGQIESAYIAHHLGWLNVSLETALHDVSDHLWHRSEKIKLPSSYGTLILTAVHALTDKRKGREDRGSDIAMQALHYAKDYIRMAPTE